MSNTPEVHDGESRVGVWSPGFSRLEPRPLSHVEILRAAMIHDNFPAEPGTPYSARSKVFDVRDYDLAATLTSGQAFRWRLVDDTWIGVIGNHWVRLRSTETSISAECAEPMPHWNWLTDYLQLDLDLSQVLARFPDDEPMRAAVTACQGLRLLRQDPWECLASFILSSTKQIIQIQQIITLLCERFGKPISSDPTFGPAHAFPSPARLAQCAESDLRDCKMGFRAPYLLETAKLLVAGEFDLGRLRELPVDSARDELMKLPGVGRKIADCVLLFAYGFQSAFPVDVWVMKALRQLYFPKRKVKIQRLHRFAAKHFGIYSGYAQQYLFHYMRTRSKLEIQSRKNAPRKVS